MPTKTVKFKEEEIDKLPNNKPIVYKIFNKKEENIYTGHSKSGQGQNRIKDHLPGVELQNKQTPKAANHSE